ncbi:MAG TPA: hypothetical protein VGB87_16925 [Vicinamibacteria bacterium]
MTDGLHAVAEDVSLELHRAVAERLLEEPALVERARQRVAGWLRDGSAARPYAEAWQAVLAEPVEVVARFLADPGERARQLRQTSPFAGFLEPRTRWSIWRRSRQRATGT